MLPVHDALGVRYGVLEEADADEMATLLAAEFSRFEPMSVAIDIGHDPLLELVKLYVPKAVAEGVTIVARDAASGELVGAVLTDDFGTPVPDGVEGIERFAPIASLLEELDVQYQEGKTIQPGQYIHQFMLAVSRDATGRQIGQNLVHASLVNGQRRGYRMAVTEATGSTSQHIFRKHGFQDRLTTRYPEYRFGGEPVFASIQGHLGTILMDRELA